jgi:hypothetical protein
MKFPIKKKKKSKTLSIILDLEQANDLFDVILQPISKD